MASTISDLIVAQAEAQGIPPAIALAVAQQESGIQQWTPDGNLVMGGAGDTGVFQIIPSTAAGLGIDATDLNQNVQGGVSLLAQLYAQYGNWVSALSAYNSGSPTRSTGYANSVLGIASNQYGYSSDTPPAPVVSVADYSSVDDSADLGDDFSDVTGSLGGTVTIGILLAGLAFGWWLLEA
jgi:soluble lytic murein transglycosylase-like protein